MGIIGSIRKHSGLAVTIVGLAIVAFIIGDVAKNRRIPDMGKIGSTTITSQHFNAMTQEMEEQYKQQTGQTSIPAEAEYQIREQVWQNLMQETLMGEQMAKLGISVSKEELNDMYAGTFIHPYLRQMFTDPQTGVYNVQAVKSWTDNFDKLDSVAQKQWMDLEKSVRKDRAMTKYTSLITKGLYMPSSIARQIAELSATSSNCRVALASFQSVPDAEVNPTEDDFKKYYEDHKAEFRVREELRNLEFVAFPIAPTQEDLTKIANDVTKIWEEMQTVSEDELGFFVSAESDKSYDSSYMKASQFPAPMDSIIAKTPAGGYIAPMVAGNQWMMAKVQKVASRPDSIRASVIQIYNSNIGQGMTRTVDQAKKLCDSVENLIKGGLAFEEAVAQFSDNKQDNGDWGWQLDGNYNFFNEDVVNHAEGSVFTVEVPNECGYFIVKVTGKTTPNTKYRVALLTRLIEPSDATEKSVYNTANQFAGQNRTYAEMLAAAQEQNLMVRNDMVSMMSNSIAGLSNTREIVRWAFDKNTKVGSVADQVYTLDNACVVVALKDVLKEGYATLEQVRPMMENQVRLEKKAELLLAKAGEAAKATKDINALAQRLGTVVDTVENVTFDAYYLGKFGMEPRVQAAVANAKGNVLVGPVKGAQGVYMVQIDNQTKVINGEEQMKAKTAEIQAQMEQAYGQKANGIITVLRDNTKVIDQRNLYF